MNARTLLLMALSAVATATVAGFASADDRPSLARRATWKAPDPAAVREQVSLWVSEDGADKSSLAAAEALWQEGASDPESPLLELVCRTLVLGEPRAEELVETCSQPRREVALPDVAWLDDPVLPDFVRDNLRLYFGRWLVHERLYDEAAEQLALVETEHVADPAALLFYQSVVHHRTLQREPGLASIARLLENESQLPRRYASLAKLMQADLEGLKDDSLDHIARRMEDVHRRLDLGRAGPKVREVEDGVIESLDKLIEEMEQQQQAAAAAAAAAGGQGGGQMPIAPLPDSMPLGGKGPGNVDKKPLGDGSGWGNLPPKEREEAMQQIGQEFPAHYRDVIEQYFRKLATEDSAEK